MNICIYVFMFMCNVTFECLCIENNFTQVDSLIWFLKIFNHKLSTPVLSFVINLLVVILETIFELGTLTHTPSPFVELLQNLENGCLVSTIN